MHDLVTVVHCHSTYSDGTGTVPQIARAAARAGVDAVLLTDHDSLEAKRRGEEGWHGSVLVCVGLEVSPRRRDHYLAFGLDREIEDPDSLTPAEIVAAVEEAGGFGFAAHPFSKGSEVFTRAGPGMPWGDLDCEGLAGLEVWSLVTDVAEGLPRRRDALRFITRPARVIERPPARNLAEWDRLGRLRRVVGIGGVDAHQFGVRVAGRVPLRLMGYHRSFAHLHTHVLLERPPSGDGARDRDAVYAALRAGRCYLAVDSLAPARGFAFDGMGEEHPAAPRELRARVPRPADLTLLHDGAPIARAHGTELEHTVQEPGVYRLEATLPAHGRDRTWILSNPVYLR
jgi:PHP domain